jgi:hypothetical protein
MIVSPFERCIQGHHRRTACAGLNTIDENFDDRVGLAAG